MTDKEFVNLQRAGVILGRPLTLSFFAVSAIKFNTFTADG